eukprot:5290760-Pleurochrysis_carterae.AAC.6
MRSGVACDGNEMRRAGYASRMQAARLQSRLLVLTRLEAVLARGDDNLVALALNLFECTLRCTQSATSQSATSQTAAQDSATGSAAPRIKTASCKIMYGHGRAHACL